MKRRSAGQQRRRPATRPRPTRPGQRRRPGAGARRWRTGRAYLDLENVLHPASELDDEELTRRFRGVVAACRRLLPSIAIVACCDGRIASRLVAPAAQLGVRLFPTRPAQDAADRALEELIALDSIVELDLVVVVSGDHAFAATATKLRAAGAEVVAVAVPQTISAELYLSVDRYVPLTWEPDAAQPRVIDLTHEAELGN